MAKKESHDKNFQGRAGWQERKRADRPYQRWVWDTDPTLVEGKRVPGTGTGHWEKM
jgi:hypothetical protein